ncbi:hypothetical protein PGT21_006302 [Puccinia graminis f. sp. tritici]|uniref:Uncharacterized protein n=1 Tax=Puccinia graminis f. sp. tritici TaxID=56615 RepID=A0A5B0LGQ9_PUCGR|nr:hypothetical protein PGTUg99_005261 [Puccinia graminis f. sp. tritici]KAA1064520.1 hypothetical protein PGT21_006302 [Puccinia graminis f. sp. tritici]
MHLDGFTARSLVAMGMLLMMMKRVSAPSPLSADLCRGPALARGSPAVEQVVHKPNCQSTGAMSEYQLWIRRDPCQLCPNEVRDRHMAVICKRCLGWTPVHNPLCDNCYKIIDSFRAIICDYSQYGDGFDQLTQALTLHHP